MNFDQIKNIVRKAGDIALSDAGNFTATYKNDDSPVTKTDLETESFLCSEIKSIFPNHKFLTEETQTDQSYNKNDYIWIIDPIDGTDAFREGLPVWGIAVGLVYKFEPVFGIFYMPASKQMFCSDEISNRLNDKKNHRSKSIYVTSDFYKKFDASRYKGKIRSLGSTVAHICFVASSAGQGAILRGFAWDIAAGSAILKASGGRLMTFDGKKFAMEHIIVNRVRSEYLIASPTKNLPEFVSDFTQG